MHTLLIGTFGEERTDAMRSACKRAGCEPTFVKRTDGAREVLSGSMVPRAIFVDGCIGGVPELVGWVRGQARLFTVPIIVLVPSAEEDAYLECHGFGADDAIVESDVRGIETRLQKLADFDPARRPEITQGEAIIAMRDERGRKVLGRILRQAGFDLSFALDADELVERSSDDALMVLEAGLPPHGAIDAVRRAKGHAIVLGSRAELRRMRPDAEELKCAFGNILAPPDHLLFLANELLRPELSNARASTRVLYGVLCSFRPAGSLEPHFGLTYNLSREGLYVRTLDPPKRGSRLWLEMRVPGQGGAIHLRGEVVWATGPQKPGGTAPPGFGLQILAEECPPSDLAAYRQGYRGLVDAGSTLRRVA